MTSPISNFLAASGATAPTSTAKAPSKDMDKDMFLKLLVAQMKYQDPTNPQNGTEFLAQSAQFTMIEKLTEVADSQAALVSGQLMLGASNLVGRTVSYAGPDGMPVTGVVTSATISGSNPTLRVGNTDVPLSSVTEVRTTNP
jgi:flagellar basal-body rod modification protein FlgD